MSGGLMMTALQYGRRGLAVLALGLAVGHYAIPARVSYPAAPSPLASRALVTDRIFFGRAIPGGGSVSEEEWATFLAEVVTPRFPDGLTVWRAEGQWTDPRGQ